MRSMLAYSPKKKRAKVTEEYSVLYPDTSSASASGRSKGALLVSASMETKKIIANGYMGSTYHEETKDWLATIAVKFNVPEHKHTPNNAKPMAIS